MAVLVDTSVWSLAYRRPQRYGDPNAQELARLIRERQAFLIGPIRQELLSGIRIPEQFERFRETLRAFPDLAIHESDYEEAARYFNRCRTRGIQGTHIDFLICAAASRHGMAIFTTDRDFQGFEKVLGIKLHSMS